MSQPKSPSASSEQDRQWVEEALVGKEEAYRHLLEKYRNGITHHVRKMVHDPKEVEDLVQDIFVKAFTSLPSYSRQYAFSTWLYRIATNHTIDYLRKKKLATFSIDQPVQTKDSETAFEIPDLTYRPDRYIIEDQRKELLQEAIDALPPKYRRVIVMRHQQEMSYEEIAEALNLPLGTVKAHIFRARQLLYKHLRGKRNIL